MRARARWGRPLARAGLASLLVSLMALAPSTSAGQEASDPRTTPVRLTRIDGPVELDGRVDEPAWNAIEPVPLTMYSPTHRGALTERTEIRFGYDDEYLYVSGRMYDSEPDQIRTNTFYRDVFSGDDLLAVVVDSFDDYETAVWFVTNPAGARNDRTVSNDAVGQGAMSSDWNAHWDVATSQDRNGWYAEFRIPFSTLGFQATGEEVVMGLISYRYIARKNERQLFPDIDPRWGGLGFAKPSRAERVAVRGVERSTPVYVTPYTLAGLQQTPHLFSPEDGSPARWTTESDPTREVGLDLKYTPTSNLTLDLTANTDFAQVEADDQQINLTRFPLFFPEKRQFFQERASTFQFGTGTGVDRLFHSRRIGLENGEITRIYGGARAVGRAGGLDFGVLAMQTDGALGGSSQNMSVARVNQQVLNPFSSVGAMVTSRLGSQRGDNVAYGVDALFRPFGDEYLTLKWAQTFDEATDEGSALERGLVFARWERQVDGGLSYGADYVRVGRSYRPGLGFQSRTDFERFGGSTQVKRFLGAESPLRSVAASVDTEHFYRGEDGSAESRSIRPEFTAEFKSNAQVTLRARSSFESVRETFPVAGLEVVPGDYWFHEGEARIQLSRNALFRGDLTASAGSFYDGTRWALTANPTWTQSRFLELSGSYQLNRLEFEDRAQATTAHLARLKAQIALDTRISFSILGQVSSTADLSTVNARFRFHFREGTDLWVVYNEGFNIDRDPFARPRAPRSAGRTLMIKYNHVLIW